jgi:uncharacterized SAM-dependent methyltransferase
MYLVSRREQGFTVAGRRFRLRQAERILTEHSYKYSPEGFRHLAARAGFTVEQVWTDENRWFSVQYCTRD